MRSLLLLLPPVLMMQTGILFAAPPADPEPASKDPWVGTYMKYTNFLNQHPGQRLIAIIKAGDIYRLSEPYSNWKFKEVEPGVLSDGPGGIGKIDFGTVKYPDGVEARILRADFCYEWFLLFGGVNPPEEAKSPQP